MIPPRAAGAEVTAGQCGDFRSLLGLEKNLSGEYDREYND
jgi:hypothetical protein